MSQQGSPTRANEAKEDRPDFQVPNPEAEALEVNGQKVDTGRRGRSGSY